MILEYKDSWVKFEDCIEGMKELEDKSIDLCLTDPPYNNHTGQYQGFKYNNRPKRLIYEDYREDYLDWCKEWFKEIERITITQLVFCGLNNIKMWYNHFDVKDLLIIYKPFSGYGSKIAVFSQYAPMICCGEISQQLNHNVIKDMTCRYGEGFVHPHPKQLLPILKIIQSINPSSVLDPFMGSGTTLEACIQLGIPCYGFELMEEYREDMEKRIERSKYYRRPQLLDKWI